MEIGLRRAERILLLYAENGHENILADEENFTTAEKHNNQDNKIFAEMSLEVSSEGAGRPSHFLRHGQLSHQGVTSSFLRERCKMGARVYQEDVDETWL